MEPPHHENQLELFDVSRQPAARVRREQFGRVSFHLRSDQLILGTIGTLLSGTIVFAFGVERGKHLVRAERMLLARQQEPPVEIAKADRTPSKAPSAASSAAQPAKPSAPKSKSDGGSTAPAKTKAAPVKVAAAKPAAVSSKRYAVQVVTYTTPQMAKRELARLQARGETAFLLMREGRTHVFVGPFPSKGNATQKVTSLRGYYRDCFVKPL